MTGLHLKIASSIHSIEPAEWDQLSEQRPFQSHNWYSFGERVMADCTPVYLLAYQNETLIGRAGLWLVRNEPLPPSLPAPLRGIGSALLNRYPLLICRSALANASGLILPEGSSREAVLLLLTEAALAAARRLGASIVLFDFLKEAEVQGWPSGFVRTEMPNAGTVMQNRWQSMDEYLAHSTKKDRQHYKRSLREAEKRNIRLSRPHDVTNMEAALDLIRTVERRHDSPPNPWIHNMLRNFQMVNGTWLEAHIGNKLVGCGLIFEDNGAQMTTALGLAENEAYVYFLLVYASLEVAFERHVQLLRWGTGAYEVKKRLGFELERNNLLILRGTNRLTNLIGRLAA